MDRQMDEQMDRQTLFGQRLRREPEETKSCKTGGICTSSQRLALSKEDRL